MLSRRLLAALVAAPLLLTTACGEAIREQPNPQFATKVSLPAVQPTIGSAPPTPSSAAPSTPASSAPASSAASGSAPAASGNEVKAGPDTKFSPDKLEVKVGTEVTWTNAGGFHTVTGGDGTPDPGSPIGNHPLGNPGDTVKVTFDKPGTYSFFCQPHKDLGMKGQIVVT
jgi:plastocyanin